MIQLTRLNNSLLVVNSDLIKFIESAPDTVITLLTGEKIVVRETVENVMDQVTAFRRRILQGTVFLSTPALHPASAPESPSTAEPSENR
jgi:flagellar protein FlbD